MIKALIFDFDGLILDTEGPEYQSWQKVYQEYGCSLPLSEWVESIGSSDVFDPYDYLAQQLGRPVDRGAIRARHSSHQVELLASLSLLPGVEEYLSQAKRLGLKLGLASSSSRRWVIGHLADWGLEARFDSIKCADDVERTKPDPALYLAALRALNVQAHEAIALEDSPNGVLAAKRAGIFCVAVPNALTRQLELDLADLQLVSLAELPLKELLLLAASAQHS
jgi:HAD superfamily hydrolase (TIGR01509 family)